MTSIKEKEYIISTSGYSRILVKPDVVTIEIALECTSDTMEHSLESINVDMASLYSLTKEVKIKKEHIHVVDLDFDLEHEWKKSTKVFVGYKVRQQVTIELDVTVENEIKARTVISRLAGLLSCLKQCSVNYGLKNRKSHLSKVRELAFIDAREKAEQYAELAGTQIVGTNTITDIETDSGHSEYDESCVFTSSIGSPHQTNLPDGKKIVLTSQVFVVFDISTPLRKTGIKQKSYPH